MIYVYAVLVLVIIALPPFIASVRAGKRGKSGWTAAPFVLPYYALLALLFFWFMGFRGVELLGAMFLTVGLTALSFYIYETRIGDIGLRQRKK